MSCNLLGLPLPADGVHVLESTALYHCEPLELFPAGGLAHFTVWYELFLLLCCPGLSGRNQHLRIC